MPTPLPAKLPAVTGQGHTAAGFRLAFAAINQLIDVCRSLMPAKSDNTLTSHTAIGVLRKGNPAPTRRAAGGLNFRGEWDDDAIYEIDDIVTRTTDADFDDGTVAGTYIAVAEVDNDDPAPTHGDGRWELLAKAHFDHLIIRGASLADGSVDIDIDASQGRALAIRELDVCVNGVPKKQLFICSEPYSA